MVTMGDFLNLLSERPSPHVHSEITISVVASEFKVLQLYKHGVDHHKKQRRKSLFSYNVLCFPNVVLLFPTYVYAIYSIDIGRVLYTMYSDKYITSLPNIKEVFPFYHHTFL